MLIKNIAQRYRYRVFFGGKHLLKAPPRHWAWGCAFGFRRWKCRGDLGCRGLPRWPPRWPCSKQPRECWVPARRPLRGCRDERPPQWEPVPNAWMASSLQFFPWYNCQISFVVISELAILSSYHGIYIIWLLQSYFNWVWFNFMAHHNPSLLSATQI